MTITIGESYITLDDGDIALEVLKFNFEPIEIGEPYLELTYSQANRGEFSKTVDYSTTTVNGQSPGSAEELKEILLNQIIMPSITSTGNSSTDAIGASATFTGTGELNGLPDVMVVLKTDTACTLYFDFSTDGSNWDSTFPPSGFVVTAGISEFHTAVKGPRYFRVRLVNEEASDQTYLRMATYYGTFRQGNLPLNASMGQDADSQIVRPTDFKYDVARGKVSGNTTWNKFGYNEDVDTGGEETIWSTGGNFVRLTSADTLDVVSDNAGDDLGSSGAEGITIIGIDANHQYQSEDVEMDGTNPVTTSGSWLGINRVIITSVGATGTNDGLITITDTGGGSTQAEMPAGEGVTQQAIFFVQENHIGLVDWLWINVLKISPGSTPIVIIRAWVTNLDTGVKMMIFKTRLDTDIENTKELKPSQPFVVEEESMLEFTAETDTDDTIVYLRFSLIEQQIV